MLLNAGWGAGVPTAISGIRSSDRWATVFFKPLQLRLWFPMLLEVGKPWVLLKSKVPTLCTCYGFTPKDLHHSAAVPNRLIRRRAAHHALGQGAHAYDLVRLLPSAPTAQGGIRSVPQMDTEKEEVWACLSSGSFATNVRPTNWSSIWGVLTTEMAAASLHGSSKSPRNLCEGYAVCLSTALTVASIRRSNKRLQSEQRSDSKTVQ